MILLLIIGILIFVWKIVKLAIKAAWSITKVVCYVIFLPGVIISLFLAGFVYIAIPLLLISILFSFIRS